MRPHVKTVASRRPPFTAAQVSSRRRLARALLLLATPLLSGASGCGPVSAIPSPHPSGIIAGELSGATEVPGVRCRWCALLFGLGARRSPHPHRGTLRPGCVACLRPSGVGGRRPRRRATDDARDPGGTCSPGLPSTTKKSSTWLSCGRGSRHRRAFRRGSLAQLTSASVGHTVRLIGWGLSSAAPPLGAERREGEARIAEVQQAKVRLVPAPVSACVGDSGGPAFTITASSSALVGVIVSGDQDCSRQTVVARADAFWRFVESAMVEDGGCQLSSRGAPATSFGLLAWLAIVGGLIRAARGYRASCPGPGLEKKRRQRRGRGRISTTCRGCSTGSSTSRCSERRWSYRSRSRGTCTWPC